jgi:hypothetical protein
MPPVPLGCPRTGNCSQREIQLLAKARTLPREGIRQTATRYITQKTKTIVRVKEMAATGYPEPPFLFELLQFCAIDDAVDSIAYLYKIVSRQAKHTL